MAHRFRDEWLVALARDSHGVPPDFIESARRGSHVFLVTALVRGGLVTPDALAASVSRRYGCGVVRPSPGEIDRALLDRLPERICRQHYVLPLSFDGGQVQVATANPLDVRAEDEIRFATGRTPTLLYCTPDHLEELIAHVLEPDQVIFDLLRKVEVSQPVELIVGSTTESGDDAIHAPVIRLVNAIVAKAVDSRPNKGSSSSPGPRGRARPRPCTRRSPRSRTGRRISSVSKTP